MNIFNLITEVNPFKLEFYKQCFITHILILIILQTPMPFYADPNRFPTPVWQADPSQGMHLFFTATYRFKRNKVMNMKYFTKKFMYLKTFSFKRKQ